MSKCSLLLPQIKEYLDKCRKDGFNFINDESHLLKAAYNEINISYDEIRELQAENVKLRECVKEWSAFERAQIKKENAILKDRIEHLSGFIRENVKCTCVYRVPKYKEGLIKQCYRCEIRVSSI